MLTTSSQKFRWMKPTAPRLRLHMSFKIAAKMGHRYLDLRRQNEAVIAKNVTENLYERHVVPYFWAGKADFPRQFILEKSW